MNQTPDLPTLPDNLKDATVLDMDAHYAVHYDREHQIEDRIAAAIKSAHRAIGEKPKHFGRSQTPSWPTTSTEALAKARELAASPGYKESPWQESPRKAVAAYDQAMCDLHEMLKDRAPLDAEWRQRGGWARYFEVVPEAGSKDGHVHSSMHCSTCNRNGKPTRFEWHPELSGLTEKDAVAALGPKLCTVCFKSAPLEWTIGPAKPAGCENAPYDAATRSRPIGISGTRYADCTQCDAKGIAITQANRLRRHKPVRDAGN